MKVAVDVSPLSSGHKVRGTGFYLKNLVESLKRIDDNLIFFNKIEEAKEADVVHFPYFDPFFVTLPIRSKIPYVVTVHDLTPLVFPKDFPVGIKGKIKWQIQKNRAKKASAIITDSIASRNDISKILNYPEDKINVVYLAASEKFSKKSDSEIQKVRKKYNLPEEFVLYVGDATPNKNVLRLFKSIEKIKIPLVVVGKALSDNDIVPNPWNKELREAQNVARKSKFIKIIGFVDEEDLPILYSAAKVFAFPSLYEGFGLPVLEAMSAETPVVTTHGGSLKEVVNQSALIVDGLNVDSISQGIKEMYSNEKLRQEYVRKGLENSRKFSWEKTAEETYEVYKTVFKTNE